MNESVIKILKDRYFLDTENSWDNLADRVSAISPQIGRLIHDMMFIPSSPTLMNGNTGGKSKGTLSSCFPMGVDDSMESITDSWKECALVTKASGGVGYDFSKLRGSNELVDAFGRNSSGPLPFIDVHNSILDGIQQGGRRRGAGFAGLMIDHPDILHFIKAKANLDKYVRFNFSVLVTDDFYKKMEDDENQVHYVRSRKEGSNQEYPLVDEDGNQVTIKQLWDLIIHYAWQNAEPGIINISIAINQSTTVGVPIIVNGKEIVFDIVTPNPCTEFVNIPFSSCNLASSNLLKFVVLGPNGKYIFDWNSYGFAVDKGTFFLDDVIDINEFPIKKIEDTTKQIRPIGLGYMGMAHAMIKMGISYASKEGIEFTKNIALYTTLRSMRASVERAKQSSPYPAYNYDRFMKANERFFTEDSFMDIDVVKLKKDIKKYGVRNSCFTSIAPTGTISTIAEVSSGIEPLFALTYMRKIEKKNKEYDVMFINDPLFDEYLDNNFSGDKKLKILEEISNNHGSCQKVKDIPDSIKKIFVTAGDLTSDEHIEVMAMVAQNTSLSVSKTINMPKEATKEDVSNAYLKAHKMGIIGVTVYRDGCRQGILVHKDNDGIVERSAPKRPKSLPCDLYKIKVKGDDWIVFIGMYNGHPYEVFSGKIDLVNIPSSITNGEIVKLGKGKYQFVHNGEVLINDITSIFDNKDEEALTRQISTNLRHGTPIDFVIEQLGKSKGSIVDFNKSILRALKKYQQRTESEEKCPVCGAKLIYIDGCIKCEDPQCGFSKCG